MDVIDLAKLAQVDRGKLARFERGQDFPKEQWISRVERALDEFEDDNGWKPGEVVAEAAAGAHDAPIRLTFHDVFGVGEIIAEGPADRPDELIAAVSKLLAELRERGE